MLISNAYAQAAGGAPGGAFDLISLLPLVLIFVVFYFLLIRPQQKRMREHQDMIKSLKRGDKIVTGGGVYGTVVKVEDSEDALLVEIAKDVRIKVARPTVQSKIAVTQPAPANEDKPAATDAQAEKKAGGGGFLSKFTGGDKK